QGWKPVEGGGKQVRRRDEIVLAVENLQLDGHVDIMSGCRMPAAGYCKSARAGRVKSVQNATCATPVGDPSVGADGPEILLVPADHRRQPCDRRRVARISEPRAA